MFTQQWKSETEIDKAYSEHLESVEMSGVEFDKPGLLKEWARALKEFTTSLDTPKWGR